MRFILFVEGRTEHVSAADFLKRWLDPQLAKKVGIQTVAFDGYASLAQKIATKARMYLEGPKKSEIIAVIGLLDLYGPDFYPCDKTTVTDRHAWAKNHFESAVDSERFRMFFAVHEFEAWLLSQPDVFPKEVQTKLPSKIARPEEINFHEPPAKLLDRVFKHTTGRNYKKTTYGKQFFAKLDPANAASKCPYLKVMLEEMLLLARAAGL